MAVDYLSAINQGGSGLNITQIVDSLVDAEKAPQEDKIQKTIDAKNTAISKARRMIDICVQIAEDEKARPYRRIQAANTVLDKALKFDENDFMRK